MKTVYLNYVQDQPITAVSSMARAAMNRLPALLLWLVLSALRAPAQDCRNLGSICDAWGRTSTDTVTLAANGDGAPVAFKHTGAAGQPGGIFTNANGSLCNYAGFLQAVDIKKRDQAGPNGPYELTVDNDGDRLSDTEEITGAGWPDNPGTFTDPNDPDTDHDKMSDQQESVAGSNPNDPVSLLRITDMQRAGDSKVIFFSARGDGHKRYRIMADDGSYSYPSQALATNVYTGGAAPWYETTAAYTNAGASDSRSYAIEALR
jgi:hypothetical protein